MTKIDCFNFTEFNIGVSIGVFQIVTFDCESPPNARNIFEKCVQHKICSHFYCLVVLNLRPRTGHLGPLVATT